MTFFFQKLNSKPKFFKHSKSSVLARVRGCVSGCARARFRAWMRAYVVACVGARVRGCLRAYGVACARACVRSRLRACLRACMFACARACVLACVRAYVCACLHAYVHLDTQNYTETQCGTYYDTILICTARSISSSRHNIELYFFHVPVKMPVAMCKRDMCVSVCAVHVFMQYTSAVCNIFISYVLSCRQNT